MDVADLMLVLQPRGGGSRDCIPWHQRSESLLEYARKRKRIKRLEREVGDVQCQKQLATEALHDLQMLVPGVSRRLGQVHVRGTPEAMADGAQLLAMLPTSRDHAARRAQSRVASVVVVAALQQQRDGLDFALASPSPDASQEGRCVVLAYAHPFDEATQKCRALLPKGTWESLRCSLGPRQCRGCCSKVFVRCGRRAATTARL
jgi:hypothetical protein